MPEVELCINIPEVEGCAHEQQVKMSHMVQEHDNMNLPHSKSMKQPEVYHQNIINCTV